MKNVKIQANLKHLHRYEAAMHKSWKNVGI